MAAPESEACAAMERSVRQRVPPLLTDLYHFTMAYAYWRSGRHDEPAAFELFFRDNPFGGGFSLFAGLHDCLLFLKHFSFSEEDVQYLRSVLPGCTDPAFFCYLRSLDCSQVTLRSVPEGQTVFARVPLVQVSGPLAVVQLLETSLLCLVNYASLVCSNAARFRLAAGPRLRLLELGLRRAQGPDGGLTASRYSHIGGFDVSSNVLAGCVFGIPVSGTMAHSFVTSFSSLEQVQPRTLSPARGGRDPVDLVTLSLAWRGRICVVLGVEPGQAWLGELAAFLSYAVAFPDQFLAVIDTYSVHSSGLVNFCAVALALCELHYRPLGVRLDSGDICRQSVEVRRVFRVCSEEFAVPSLLSLSIVGTNNITEDNLRQLSHTENEIDVVGVGTHLVTCTLQPSLGCVYKLVEVSGRPRMKLSEDPEKSTLPGRKSVYRLYSPEGHPFVDLLCLWGEGPPQSGLGLRCHPLGGGQGVLTVTPTRVEELLQDCFTQGQVTQPLPTVAQLRERVQVSVNALHPRHTQLSAPDTYTVAVSERLHALITECTSCNSTAGHTDSLPS
ncbi:nicotinate phosphoribosyltransferase [Amia ocellicauda]|uniref:nicotinate phosphoribosyltransferase n=1 Tax=Amia ocellicauda TaxID=2972642 RepID=UPI0034641D69